MNDLDDNPPAGMDPAVYAERRDRLTWKVFKRARSVADLDDTALLFEIIGLDVEPVTYRTAMPTGMLRPGISPVPGSGGAWKA